MTTFAQRFAPTAAAAIVLTGLTVVAQPAVAAGPVPGSYVVLTPTRVLDTRTGAYGNRRGAVGAHGKAAVRVTGASGVPATASAVAITVSVVAAARSGSVTASTAGLAARPKVTTVQFRAGGRATDLAVVRPTRGRITLWNVSAGKVHLVADVLGYYVGGRPTADGALRMRSPKRAVDARVPAGGSLSPRLGRLAGLPGPAGAAAATVTVVNPSRAGSLIAYATATTRPSAPLLDYSARRSASQFAVLPVSDVQQLTLRNTSKRSVRVFIDVTGWFPDGPAATARTQQVVAANRIYRDGALPAHRSDAVRVLGKGGVPRRGVSSVVVSTRVSGPTRAGVLVGGSRAAPIVTSFRAAQRATGEAILRVHNSRVTLRNASTGRLALEVDVVGYIVSSTISPPVAPSVARYANDLKRVRSAQDLNDNENLMNQHGQGDAGAGFVLLDLGAQTVTAPLSPSNPGIALALTGDGRRTVRISYPDLVAIIKSYIDGIATGGRHVLLAVGTNNGGDWSTYRAGPRGRHFANVLINPLATYGAPLDVSVVGANDIESQFASTEAQAEDWETAYFANTSADLIYNGALNDCPTVFGDRSTCAFGWTQADYGRLTRHVEQGRNRTMVLPQIYFPVQAVQWANVYAHAGPLRFVGSLTQFASDPTTYRPAQGWAALTRALQWRVAAPGLPRAVDILTP